MANDRAARQYHPQAARSRRLQRTSANLPRFGNRSPPHRVLFAPPDAARSLQSHAKSTVHCPRLTLAPPLSCLSWKGLKMARSRKPKHDARPIFCFCTLCEGAVREGPGGWIEALQVTLCHRCARSLSGEGLNQGHGKALCAHMERLGLGQPTRNDQGLVIWRRIVEIEPIR